MRRAFIQTLTALAEADERVHLVTSDTGFTVFEGFQARFPTRYLNVGISESAMVGYAAGLALAGRVVFLYGIAPFVTLRPLEFVRNDLCMHRLPVRIVGVGEGLTYGPEGATHHAVEDIAAMSALPGMTVVCPGDPVETAALVAASAAWEGPIYFRLGKSGEPVVHEDAGPASVPGPEPGPTSAGLAIGRAATVRQGSDAVLLATGNQLPTAAGAADILAARGCSAAVVSVHTISPFDERAVGAWARRCPVVATIEEHVHAGGLGSRVAGVLAAARLDVELLRCAVDAEYVTEALGHETLRRRYGLTPEAVAARVLAACGRRAGAASDA